MSLGRRRTKAGIAADRERQWAWLKTHAYCGFRTCTRCKRVTFCAGKRYESQRCKACHMAGNGRIQHTHTHAH